MVNFQVGQIVISKSGRDKGMAFIVLSTEGEYLYLADGQLRSMQKPKKKKLKHIQPTSTVSAEIVQTINSGRLLDSDLRKAIAEFRNKL